MCTTVFLRTILTIKCCLLRTEIQEEIILMNNLITGINPYIDNDCADSLFGYE